ncbi:MAG: hypothetical protein WC787_03350 [Patescibacteria group bacterium]|jgi:hypothetical protein
MFKLDGYPRESHVWTNTFIALLDKYEVRKKRSRVQEYDGSGNREPCVFWFVTNGESAYIEWSYGKSNSKKRPWLMLKYAPTFDSQFLTLTFLHEVWRWDVSSGNPQDPVERRRTNVLEMLLVGLPKDGILNQEDAEQVLHRILEHYQRNAFRS